MTDDKSAPAANPQALTDDKNLDPGDSPDESTLEVPEGQLSNLWLVILGSAFFALWALNASVIEQTAMILPVVAKEFRVSSSQVQWIAASNTIVWGSLQIVAGRCCDIYGRKRAFHCGMVFWTVPTILSTFMPNLAALNVCRGFAGIGAAVVLPAAAGMIGIMYPSGRKRTLAFVAVSCGGAVGGGSGLLIAGALLEYSRWTWRPVYLVIGLAFLWPWAIVTWLVPADLPHAKNRKLDWLGSLLLGLSLFLLLFGFNSSQTEKRGWTTPYVPVLIVGSGLLMGLFVLRQIQLTKALASGRKAQPLIPRSLLSLDCWNLLVFYLASALAWGSGDTYYALVAYLYLDVLDLRPLHAGLRIGVVTFGGLAAALAVGITINWVPPRALISIFCGIQVTSPVLMAIRHLDWPYWYADLWSFLLVAFNTDVLVAAGLTLVSLTAPIEDGSVAAAIFQTSCRVGYAIGLAIATLIQTNVEKRELAAGVGEREALAAGVRGGFWFCAASSAASTLVVLFGMRGWQKLSEMKQGQANKPEEVVGPTMARTTSA